MASNIPTKSSFFLFKGLFGKILGFSFILLFIVIPLIYAVTISVKAHSIEPGIAYLGPKFLKPTQVINDESLIIIENQSAYTRTENFWGGIWGFIILNWIILSSMYIIYRWIWGISKLWGSSPFSTSVNNFANWTMGFIIFIIFQIIFLLATTEEPNKWSVIMIPIIAFINLAKAFPYIILPFVEVFDKSYTGEVNKTIINNVTNIS